MIPTPKLDDRTYADIVAEAMRLIPRYAPEWTNHNPSDPGITMLELTAWMTELISFDLVEGAERQQIREGTQVATPQAADEDTVVFETQRDLLVTGVKLD